MKEGIHFIEAYVLEDTLVAERVNEIATPCVMNLLCRVVLFQSASFALAVG